MVGGLLRRPQGWKGTASGPGCVQRVFTSLILVQNYYEVVAFFYNILYYIKVLDFD